MAFRNNVILIKRKLKDEAWHQFLFVTSMDIIIPYYRRQIVKHSIEMEAKNFLKYHINIGP